MTHIWLPKKLEEIYRDLVAHASGKTLSCVDNIIVLAHDCSVQIVFKHQGLTETKSFNVPLYAASHSGELHISNQTSFLFEEGMR